MPKTKEQFEQVKRERKDAILSASLFLFATKGYEATTTDDVTKLVGCSHGLLYHYFGSKEDLFRALMEEKVCLIISEIIKDVNFDDDPSIALMTFLDAMIGAIKSPDNEKACALYLVLNLKMQSKSIPKPKHKIDKKPLFEYLFELIERGKTCGEFNDFDTREMFVSLLSFFKGLSYSRIYLGHKKITCPSSKIVSRMIIKN